MKKLGLIGFPLGHSFSKKYYLQKFATEDIQGIDYDLYPLPNIEQLPSLYTNDDLFYGFNVTIPYKQSVMPYLTDLSPEASAINAVNCVKILRKGSQLRLIGYNTDAYGFEASLLPLVKPHHKEAIILGNGGAAKAVMYVLKKLKIPFTIISRQPAAGDLSYEELRSKNLQDYPIIINCSPVGTYPHVDQCPAINYDQLSVDHLLYDLVYNPAETLFLKKGNEKGAVTKNGEEMLVLQAEKNWEIWNSSL